MSDQDEYVLVEGVNRTSGGAGEGAHKSWRVGRSLEYAHDEALISPPVSTHILVRGGAGECRCKISLGIEGCRSGGFGSQSRKWERFQQYRLRLDFDKDEQVGSVWAYD